VLPRVHSSLSNLWKIIRPSKLCNENVINVPKETVVPTFISPLGNFLGEVGPSCEEKVSQESFTSHDGFSKWTVREQFMEKRFLFGKNKVIVSVYRLCKIIKLSNEKWMTNIYLGINISSFTSHIPCMHKWINVR